MYETGHEKKATKPAHGMQYKYTAPFILTLALTGGIMSEGKRPRAEKKMHVDGKYPEYVPPLLRRQLLDVGAFSPQLIGLKNYLAGYKAVIGLLAVGRPASSPAGFPQCQRGKITLF